jgi:energy-coupling factor transporter ATP-binding protein EcfA2
MALVNVHDVTYTYPLMEVPALTGINLTVQEGEFVALIGPNGAGKSTLCYAISGFIPHFFTGTLEGSITVKGLETRDAALSEWVMNVGLAFQNPFNQISGSKFTVFEEVAFGLENMGVPRAEMKERVEQALKMTDISHLADRSPYSLSGGQQQRVALTSILVMEPKVLVLDEPTSQLDPIGTRKVLQVIKDMSGKGMTVVLASHKIEWIAEYADRVIVLDEGEMLMAGSPRDVLTSPELLDRGFGTSKYTSVAYKASQEGLWPEDTPLPITLEEAAQGFKRMME